MKGSAKGDYSELLVMVRAKLSGFEVATPFGNQPGWDLLVDPGQGFERWQVKTCGKNRGHLSIDLRRGSNSRKRDYDRGSYDRLVGVCPDTSRYWVYSEHEVIERTRIHPTDSELWEAVFGE